jgi:hypothetical protein
MWGKLFVAPPFFLGGGGNLEKAELLAWKPNKCIINKLRGKIVCLKPSDFRSRCLI